MLGRSDQQCVADFKAGAWHVTCDVQTSNDMMDIPPATVTVRINGADFM